MAELAVKVSYKNNAFLFLRKITSATFPVWGIVLPLVGVAMFLISLGSLFSPQVLTMFWSFFALCIAALLSIGMLVLHTVAQPGELVVTAKGIRFPFLAGQKHASFKLVDWSEIETIEVYDQLSNEVLTLFLKSGKRVELILSEFDSHNIEPLITAIEMWAGCDKVQARALELKNKKAIADSSGSFTKMWEEELARRFHPTAFMPLLPERTLRKGNLKVIRQLATGGLSAIYLCQERNSLVVLKESVLPANTKDDTKIKAKEMFEREAILLAKIDHAGIVKVRDYFIEDSRHYLVLDYLNGQDLRQLVFQNGPRRELQVIEMAIQICAVMKYLHSQIPSILHRDLTPDNMVMTNDGSVVIIDFGAANEFIGTATGTLVGKQSYISPEQFRGKACEQSDIYSFGCTLFFLLTGQDPEPLSVSHPKEQNENISDFMNDLVAKCTDMQVKNRFESFLELDKTLKESLVAGDPA